MIQISINMFHNLYIVTENGVCIFAKHFIKSQIDNQLITGFISALGSFAIEALGVELQSLRLQTGEQLSILRYNGPIPLIGLVIADAKDNDILIRNILNEILSEFCSIFYRQLIERQVADITEFQEFTYTVDIILEKKVSSRTGLKMILGVLGGLLLIGVFLLALIPAIVRLDNFNPADYGVGDIIFSDGFDPSDIKTIQAVTLPLIGILIGSICIISIPPTVLAGYIAGDRRRGVQAAILLGVSIGIIILIASISANIFKEVNAFLWYLAFSPLLLFLALVFGRYGGRLKERRKLFPLPEKQDNFFFN
ncbi:MAG: hypothetical protein ACTSRS_02990 [Candidatus Helarchaeota archaeon]